MKHCLVAALILLSGTIARSQNGVGIGIANPNQHAVLDLVSPGNNQGVLVPRLTTAQRTAAAFVNALTTTETGLLVFDSDIRKFFYWDGSVWKEVGEAQVLTAGSGVAITGDQIEVIPQDLELNGSTLRITNNPAATAIDLTPFTGTNTDDQQLTYDPATGELTISRAVDGPQTVTLSATGTAGGDLTGNFPNPTLATNAITGTKIQDGSVTSSDLSATGVTAATYGSATEVPVFAVDAAGRITSVSNQGISGVTPGGAASGDLTGTYPGPTLANDVVTSAKIVDGTITSTDLAASGVTAATYGSATQVPVVTVDAAGRITTASNLTIAGVAPGGAAGGDLAGTYPNPTVANNAITTAKILDGTITSADLSASGVTAATYGSATQVAVVTVDAAGRITTASNQTISGVAPGGAAGGDLTGTYPSPQIAADAVTGTEIADGSITNAHVASGAAIAVSKLQPGTNGQVLTTGGGTAQWATVGAALINDIGSNNLHAGNGTSTGGTDNAVFGELVAPGNTGSWNVFVGTQAAQNKTSGDLNVIIGWLAGQNHATHQGNTLVGAQAGQQGTPNVSTLIGEKAGRVTTGTSNVMVGQRAGENVTSGFNNVLIGTVVAQSVTTADRLVLIGHGANSTDNITNSVAIGNTASVNASNKIRLGNAAVTVIEGQVAFTAASDARLKKNIEPLKEGLDFVMSLRPVSYQMKDHDDGKTNWGFIAQDIETLVGTNNAVLTIGGDADRTLGLRYTDFVAPLVKAVQEQQLNITQLKDELSRKDAQIKALEESLKLLEARGTEMATIKADLEKIKSALGMEANGKK